MRRGVSERVGVCMSEGMCVRVISGVSEREEVCTSKWRCVRVRRGCPSEVSEGKEMCLRGERLKVCPSEKRSE